jgi:hypothetical protein
MSIDNTWSGPGLSRLATIQRPGIRRPQTRVASLRDRPWTTTAADRCFNGLPRVLWQTVHAEVLLRTDQPCAALDVACETVDACLADLQDDLHAAVPRLLPAFAVWADLHIYVGGAFVHHPAWCRTYELLAEHAGNPHRITLAKALLVVAVFHHQDAERGRHDLQQLLLHQQALTGHQMTRMLTTGLTAMTDAITGRRQHHTDVPAHRIPAAGGHLYPDVTRPPQVYLASRIQRHPRQRIPVEGEVS